MFVIPIFASVLHLTLISIELFVAMKYTFRYLTIVTGPPLKIAVVSSWVIACCPAILRSLSEKLDTTPRVRSVLGCFHFGTFG